MINIFFNNLYWSFNIIEIYSLCLNKVRKNLAVSASCSCRRLKAPTVGALPSEHRIATIPVCDLDSPPLFANFSLSFVPFTQYAGWR